MPQTFWKLMYQVAHISEYVTVSLHSADFSDYRRWNSVSVVYRGFLNVLEQALTSVLITFDISEYNFV